MLAMLEKLSGAELAMSASSSRAEQALYKRPMRVRFPTGVIRLTHEAQPDVQARACLLDSGHR